MEMAIVISLYLILVFGIIEFALIIFHWSRLVEGTRTAARYAIVNDPACNIFNLPWDPTKPHFLKQSCSSAPLDCSGGAQETYMSIAGNCTVSDTGEQAQDAACRIVSEHKVDSNNEILQFRGNMRGIQPLINSPETDVIITYTCTDAGFAGLAQKVPAVTVETRDVNYNLIVPGLLGLDVSVTMPAFATTRTGEDMSTVK